MANTNRTKRRMTGAEVICEVLLSEGNPPIFGIPGGAVLPLYDAFTRYPKLRHVLVRHEQGAAMAADGYARATGKVGTCLATSGPGATNLITGLAGALMDSVPVVAITGQVGRGAIGKDAFQETDITGVTLSVTKHNYLVTRSDELGRILHEAFYIARSGRPGPVLVDIPKDIQQLEAKYDRSEPLDLPGYSVPKEGDDDQIKRAVELIDTAARPIILAGHGIITSGSFNELGQLAEKARIPVVTSLLGISALNDDHPLNVGFPGMHGMAYASLALDEADLIISLGARFDDRIVGDPKRFARQSKKIHVDIDPAEIGKMVETEVGIIGDVRFVMRQLYATVKPGSRPKWLERIDELKRKHPLRMPKNPDSLLGQQVVKTLSDITAGDALICTGVGQHQMWAAQWYEFKHANSLLTSGGLGSMGYEVPSAIGAQLGCPDRQVWSICGDGGFQMALMELATVVENKLPIKYLVLNNNHLGMITQWQDMFYENRYSCSGYSSNPDLVKLAEAYGIKGMRVSERADLERTLRAAARHDGPVVIDAVIKKVDNVYPMIPSGQSIKELLEEPN